MASKDETETQAAVAEKPEKGEGGKSKGKGKGKASGKKSGKDGKEKALTKDKALAQITALDKEDDEREAISKKISWILRRGAARIGINVLPGEWIKFSDLLNCDLLEDCQKSEEKLKSIIDESNKQKLRYESMDSKDGELIRALKKEERKSKSGAPPGEKPEKAGTSEEVAAAGKMNGDAPAFVPGGAPAAGSASPMGGYPGMGYPGFGMTPQTMAMYQQAWAYQQALAYQGYAGMAAAAPAANPKDQRFQGRIKSFNTEKGYGFIESHDSYQVYNRDVFLHKKALGERAVGDFCSFTVEVNKDGMPQARELANSDGSGMKAKGKGKGKGKKTEGKGEKKEKKPKKDKEEGDDAEKKDTDDAAKDSGEAAKDKEAAPAAEAEKKE